MIVLRNKYFSEEEKEMDTKEPSTNKYLNLAGGIAAGLASSSSKLGSVILGSTLNGMENNSNLANKIKEELLEEAKRRGVDIRESYGNESVYTGNSKIYKITGKAKKKLLELTKLDRILDRNSILDDYGKNKIILGRGALSDVDALSHELGHEHFTNSKTTIKNFIPKLAHKIAPISNIASISAPILSYKSGKKAARLEAEGKKEDSLNKNISWALPTITNTPTLVSEAAASLHGFNQLKKHGADDTIKAIAKKKLGRAFATYGLLTGANVLSSVGARQYGKYKAKKEIEEELKKKKNDSTKK